MGNAREQPEVEARSLAIPVQHFPIAYLKSCGSFGQPRIEATLPIQHAFRSLRNRASRKKRHPKVPFGAMYVSPGLSVWLALYAPAEDQATEAEER